MNLLNPETGERKYLGVAPQRSIRVPRGWCIELSNYDHEQARAGMEKTPQCGFDQIYREEENGTEPECRYWDVTPCEVDNDEDIEGKLSEDLSEREESIYGIDWF